MKELGLLVLKLCRVILTGSWLSVGWKMHGVGTSQLTINICEYFRRHFNCSQCVCTKLILLNIGQNRLFQFFVSKIILIIKINFCNDELLRSSKVTPTNEFFWNWSVHKYLNTYYVVIQSLYPNLWLQPLYKPEHVGCRKHSTQRCRHSPD